ncbi:MAG: hypothetical protein R3336_04605, partial [Phycisphaeraceae bacterium]|nr:hypothetical protein [Phycisphaeraceae bacterium]
PFIPLSEKIMASIRKSSHGGRAGPQSQQYYAGPPTPPCAHRQVDHELIRHGERGEPASGKAVEAGDAGSIVDADQRRMTLVQPAIRGEAARDLLV